MRSSNLNISSKVVAESEISSQSKRNCESSNIHLDFRIDVPLHPQTIAPQPHCFLAPYLRLVSLSLPTFLMPFMPCPSPHKLSSAASRLHGSVQLPSAIFYVSPSPPTFPWIVLAVAVHAIVHATCFFDVLFPLAAVPRPASQFACLPSRAAASQSCCLNACLPGQIG